MTKESKTVTIALADYNHYKEKMNLYKAIVGVLMDNITRNKDEAQYSFNEIEDGVYFKDSKTAFKKLLTIIRYFDPIAYAFITDRIDIDDWFLKDALSEIEIEEDEEDQEEDE